jgi:hypothetical protein
MSGKAGLWNDHVDESQTDSQALMKTGSSDHENILMTSFGPSGVHILILPLRFRPSTNQQAACALRARLMDAQAILLSHFFGRSQCHHTI